jgi:O-antigen/teichoic acid export membrane protein
LPGARNPILGVLGRLGETPRQAGMLFSAHTAALGVGLVANLIQARWMEPAEMGRFAFCLSVVMIVGLLFELGVFPAGARVLAVAEDKQAEREALGALMLLTAVIGAALSLFIALAAIPIELIFKINVRWLLVAISAFAFLQPFQMLVEQSCQGLNQIRRLSLFQLLKSGLYLVMLVGLVAVGRLNAGTALAAYLTGIGLAALWAITRLRPSFHSPSRYVKLMIEEVRRYGFNIYLSRLTGTTAARFDQIVIAYFLNAAPLGLYAIAQKVSNPILTLSRALAITRFRAFAKLTRVPARIIKWNAAALILASTALVVLGPFGLKIVLPKYVESAPLLLPFAAFNLFAGLFQPYNMFLASHGRGAEIRNIVLVVALASLSGLILFVPRFGVAGAAWVGATAMALDYVLHLYYYRRFRQTLIEQACDDR